MALIRIFASVSWDLVLWLRKEGRAIADTIPMITIVISSSSRVNPSSGLLSLEKTTINRDESTVQAQRYINFSGCIFLRELKRAIRTFLFQFSYFSFFGMLSGEVGMECLLFDPLYIPWGRISSRAPRAIASALSWLLAASIYASSPDSFNFLPSPPLELVFQGQLILRLFQSLTVHGTNQKSGGYLKNYKSWIIFYGSRNSILSFWAKVSAISTLKQTHKPFSNLLSGCLNGRRQILVQQPLNFINLKLLLQIQKWLYKT